MGLLKDIEESTKAIEKPTPKEEEVSEEDFFKMLYLSFLEIAR